MLRYRNSVSMLAAVLIALCPRAEAVQRTQGIASALQAAMGGGDRKATREEATDNFVNPFAKWLEAFTSKGAPGIEPANASGFLTSADASDTQQTEARSVGRSVANVHDLWAS